jgi:hypothetical protein
VEISDGTSRIGIERDELRADPIQQCEPESHANQPIDQVPDRQALARRVSCDAAFQKRIDRGPKICT